MNKIWHPPADVVLDHIIELFKQGRLDDATNTRPELKRMTDALEKSGNMYREDGRLVPNIDPETGRFRPIRKSAAQ